MLSPRRQSSRSAFSMLEVIALVAVMAILAAVVIPVLYTGIDSRAVTSTKSTLDSLQAGLNRFQVQVTNYPRRISLLSDSALHSAAPLDTNTCNATISATNAAKYQTGANEPFFQRVISPSGGLPVGIGIIDDAIPVRASNSSDMFLQIRGVRVIDGQALNKLVDGDANNADGSNTSGNLRYPIPSANGTYTVVQYRVTRSATSC